MLGALLVQVALVPNVAVGGVTPNVLLLAAVTIALVKGSRAGIVAGFVGGLLFDLLGSGPIGVGAMVFCVVAFVAASLKENTFADGWLVPLVIVFLASLVGEIGYMTVLAVLGQGAGTLGGILGRALPAGLYNVVVAVVFYPWVARFLRRDKPMTTFRRLA
jgi:rod shape-determining protein MreD